MLLLVVLLLLVGLFFRQSLSPTERRLIGTWRNTVTNVTFTFHDHRTVTRHGAFLPHTWRIANGMLFTQTSFGAAAQVFGRRDEAPLQITFDNDDHVTAVYPRNGGVAYWQRIPPEAHGSSRVTQKIP